MTNPALLLHAIKGPAASCLVALLLAESPVTARWVSQVTGYAPNTITRALSKLEQFGLAAHDGKRSGWRTELRTGKEESIQSACAAEDITNCDALESVKDSLNNYQLKSSDSDSDSDSNGNLPGEPGTRETSGDEPGENAEAETRPLEGLQGGAPRLLKAAQELFGEPVLVPRGPPIPARLALAWIAQAYSVRQKLRKPARVVYANLKRGESPDQRFLDDPLTHLPRRYLVAAGLHPPPGEPSEPQPLPDEDPETSGDAPPEEPGDPALEQAVAPGSSRTARQAWQQALEIARQEAAPALVRGYLLPVRLAGYDAGAGLFTLQASSPQAQEVLQSRLAKPLERWLQGICNRVVRVSFVV